MKSVLILFCVTLIISLSSCNDDCAEGDKAVPASFFIEITDATSGENVFQNNTYTAQQVIVQDTNELIVPTRFIENVNVIQIFPAVSNSSGNTIVVKLNNPNTFQTNEISISYDVASIPEECFITYKIENILFPNHVSEFAESYYIVKL